ncbi:MAG: hypothetical protein ACR2MF_04160, partial [Chthoniobacterales bacterium]
MSEDRRQNRGFKGRAVRERVRAFVDFALRRNVRLHRPNFVLIRLFALIFLCSGAAALADSAAVSPARSIVCAVHDRAAIKD